MANKTGISGFTDGFTVMYGKKAGNLNFLRTFFILVYPGNSPADRRCMHLFRISQKVIF